MVDDLYGDLTGLGCIEGASDGAGAVKGFPGVGVNVGFQRILQLLVWVFGSGEIGVADEKALAVVVGVNEPAGDVIMR